mmetsp:Transcript_101022/g.261100  ORF Transcript_101022/g.261100 Transcript_101022/m.261100 type:complete len:302 (+) Transcript_101022:125-1030(+)
MCPFGSPVHRHPARCVTWVHRCSTCCGAAYALHRRQSVADLDESPHEGDQGCGLLELHAVPHADLPELRVEGPEVHGRDRRQAVVDCLRVQPPGDVTPEERVGGEVHGRGSLVPHEGELGLLQRVQEALLLQVRDLREEREQVGGHHIHRQVEAQALDKALDPEYQTQKGDDGQDLQCDVSAKLPPILVAKAELVVHLVPMQGVDVTEQEAVGHRKGQVWIHEGAKQNYPQVVQRLRDSAFAFLQGHEGAEVEEVNILVAVCVHVVGDDVLYAPRVDVEAPGENDEAEDPVQPRVHHHRIV